MIFADNERSQDENKILRSVSILAERTAENMSKTNSVATNTRAEDKLIKNDKEKIKNTKSKKTDNDLNFQKVKSYITESQYWAFFSYNYIQPKKEFNEYLDQDHGFSVEFYHDISYQGIILGIETGYWSFDSNARVYEPENSFYGVNLFNPYGYPYDIEIENLTMIPILFSGMLIIEMSKNLNISPILSAGICYNEFNYRIQSMWSERPLKTAKKWEYILKYGVRLTYHYYDHYGLQISSELGNVISNGDNIDFLMFKIGGIVKI